MFLFWSEGRYSRDISVMRMTDAVIWLGLQSPHSQETQKKTGFPEYTQVNICNISINMDQSTYLQNNCLVQSKHKQLFLTTPWEGDSFKPPHFRLDILEEETYPYIHTKTTKAINTDVSKKSGPR